MKKILAIAIMVGIAGIASISLFVQEENINSKYSAYAQDYVIPAWIKNNASWWATDQIDDSSFLQGIQYLIKEEIMIIPSTETSDSSGSQEVPAWIKNNAGWWAGGQISGSSFVSGIQWLISNGIIVVEEKTIHTFTDLRVAFIGDQGMTPESIAVLNLIKDEEAQMVLHQGDFDYQDDPDAWDKMISNELGDDFPYFATIGGHDDLKWNEYQEKLYDRLKKNPDVVCTGDLGVKSSCVYNGLFFVQVSPGITEPERFRGSFFHADYDLFIEEQLNDNDNIWKICSWAFNMESMQVGGKPDQTGWEVYNACKNGGAIIATAHEHSYHRTKTLIDIENQIVDSEWSEPDKLRVKDGATFVFVSGIGGVGKISNQDRCLPFFYPYGCNGEWASIYTSDQNAKHGALFCTFNAFGQPNKAYCYFKNIEGEIIDEFTVTNFAETDDIDSGPPEIDLASKNLSGTDLSRMILIRADLSNSNLTGADLSRTILIRADLSNAILTDADFSHSNLASTDLSDRDLTATILTGADLSHSNLASTDLSGMDLTGTILTGADLSHSNLANLDLSKTILIRADLTDANLAGTDLSGMDLTGTILRGMDLSEKDLTGTILTGADLTDANLAGTDLSGMDLTGTILRGMDLSEKDLTGTILTGADLTDANLPSDHLSGKNFKNTIFDGVNLSGKDLSNSDFSYADFAGANLENTNLTNALFVEVDLTKIKNKSLADADLFGASFAYSNLSGISLADAILDATNLSNANLSGLDFTVTDGITDGLSFMESNLSNSNFEGVDLSPKKKYFKIFENKAYLMRGVTQLDGAMLMENLFVGHHAIIISVKVHGNDLTVYFIFFNSFAHANLENANFKNADLESADFYQANLTNADLSGADLRKAFLDGADLSNADLSGAILDGAMLNCKNHVVCVS